MNTVNFTYHSLQKFKTAYRACTAETFIFEGNEYVKGYAKYLIQYLETKLKKPGGNNEDPSRN